MVEKNTKSAGRKWLKLSLQTPTRLVESVSDMLGVLSGSGVEISPETESGSLISGFFPVENGADETEILGSVRQVLGELFQLYAEPIPEMRTEIIDDQDWATSWKRFFTPVEIVPGLIIKPSWEEYQAAGNEKIIEMDPGQAFGTGQHESTRMALSLLTTCLAVQPVERVLDVGTGTGILAMAAALFGADSVVAIDNDPEAVRVAGENVAANGLADKVSISGTALADIQGPFSCILANIVYDVLVEMAPQLKALLSPGGRVILAGILSGEQEENIIQMYAKLGLQLQASEHDGEWAALLLEMN
ncbi:MAG: 50S ribosomal protein L11 methyltransferase [Desulfobulbaceae bacterium]|nr:50S ribosomal protein L11 methyltransferase [Desulfobulbaceae bacterium]